MLDISLRLLQQLRVAFVFLRSHRLVHLEGIVE
jgi:hypothetical protein